MSRYRQQTFLPAKIWKEEPQEDGSVAVEFYPGTDILGCQDAMYERMCEKGAPPAITARMNGFVFTISKLT